MQNALQHILVIDDSPAIAERIQRLLPHARVIPAYNGVHGLDCVRSVEQLELVVLDVHMPHNGVRVARQIREVNRALRILPFSDDPTKLAVLCEIGCAPLIAKSVSDDVLLAAMYSAAAMVIPPLPESAMMAHYFDESTVAEQGLRQSLGRSVALLVSSRSLLTAFEQAFADAHAVVVARTTNARTIEPFLSALAPSLIVADASMQPIAQPIAQKYQLPLLVVGMSLADALSALVSEPTALVFDVTDTTILQAALEATEQGQTYRDPLLSRVLTECGLPQAYHELIPFFLRGASHEDIARQVKLTKETIRNYKMAIYRFFQVDDSGALRDAINALPTDR